MTATSLKNASPAFPWWIVLVQGIFAALLGLLLVIWPGATTLAIVTIVGVYWLVGGIFGLVNMFLDTRMWGLKLFSAILGILAGLVVMNHPLWSAVLLPTTLVIFIAVGGLFIGVSNLIHAFKGGGWGAGFMGGISIVFSLIMLASPLMAAAILPLILGWTSIFSGIASIVLAFQLKKAL